MSKDKPLSNVRIAPTGDYDFTGEKRTPREGEFYFSETAKKVMVAGYGLSEVRQIMEKKEQQQPMPPPKTDTELVKNTGQSIIDPKMEDAAKKASEILSKYMNGEMVAADKVRTATQVLQIYGKLRATAIAEKAFIYSVLKDVSENKESLKKMLGANIGQIRTGG